MLPRPVRYLTILVFAYAQVFDLCCQEQVKSKHERYAYLQIQKSLINITPDMLPWSISHFNYISCREKQTNKQTNKQKRRQWPEMPFCSAIATILQHQDLLLRPISFWHQGCTCASTNLLLPTFRDNLFNMPYSISATLPEKLSLNGNFSYRLLIIVEKYQTYLRDLSHVIVHVNFTLIMIT